MKIKDFINSELHKIKSEDNKQKASELLKSVTQEIQLNKKHNPFDIEEIRKAALDTIDTVNLMNQAEYNLELMVTKYLLEHYMQTGSFNVLIKPFPDTKTDNQRYQNIKDFLQSIFN